MEGSEHAEMTKKNPYWNTRFLKSMFNWFSKNIIFPCLSWIEFNFCFCKAAAFVSGLAFSYKLAEKAIIDVLITFFIDSQLNSEEEHGRLRSAIAYDLKHAVAFVNSVDVLSSSLLIYLVYISRTFCSGHVKTTISCLVVAYACGMAILGIASSHVFSEPYIDSLIIIIGLILVALGRAGLIPYVEAFTAYQLEAHEPDQENIDNERVCARGKMWMRLASGAGSLVAIPLFNTLWTQRLITSGWVMGMTYVMFLLATPLYTKRKPPFSRIAEKPFTCIRVVWSALLKRRMQYPSSPYHFFQYNSDDDGGNDELELWPQTKFLRWIDKAAIVEFESTHGHEDEEQEKTVRLCSVTMVQETKYILKLVPMWSAFLVFGLVLSAGNTFFAFQGIYLESANSFLIYLILLQSLACETVSSNLSPLCLLSKWFPESKLKQNMMRIWAGMLISILCGAVAWRVEVRRLDIFENEYKDGMDSIPMSIWWLAPQYFLLGVMEGLAMDGLHDFTVDHDHLSRSMNITFLPTINAFVVIGIGSALNILYVYTNTTLFHKNLNCSRLDLYYKYLTIYGTPFNCVYLLLILIVFYRDSDEAVVQVN